LKEPVKENADLNNPYLDRVRQLTAEQRPQSGDTDE
jgi:hypothetical protein